MQAKRGFVQILPLVLLGVFALTTVIITNSAKKQPGPTARVVTQATGGCTFNGSFFEPGLHCVQNWAYWCYDNGNFERGDHSCGSGPAPTSASCGNWNVSCNNGEGFSTTDCVVIRDYFGGDENRWKTEACQNRCGVIGTTNTCGQGGPPAGGQGGPSSDEKAQTCETGGSTASACYGVTVGNRCTGFNGTCINNGGLSNGYAVCGCRADAAPTQRPMATATSQPTVRPQATATTRPTATRIPPSPTTATRDDYFTRLPTATPTIRFVERENVYNSPTPGIGSGYRCSNTYRGRCVGQGLVCDRTHFGQTDCPSGNNCVPIAAVCRTPAVPTNPPAGGPTSYSVSSPTPVRIGPCTSVNGTRIGEPLNGVQYVCCDGSVIRSPCLSSQPTRRPPTSTPVPRPTVDLSAVAYCAVGTSSFYRPCSECAGGPSNVEYPFGQTSSLRRCRNGYTPGSTSQINSPTPISRPTSRSASLQDGTPCGPFTINSCDDCLALTFRPRSGGGFECGRSSSTQTVQSSTPSLLRPGSPCSAPGYNVPGLPSCYDYCPGQRYTYQDQANSPAGTRVCVAYTPSSTPLPTFAQRKTTAAQDGRGGCCERRPYFENEGCFGNQTCTATDDQCESGLSCTTVPTSTPIPTSSVVSDGFRWCDPSDGKRICTPGRACTDCSLLGYNRTSSCKAFAWVFNAHCENGSEPSPLQPTYQVITPAPAILPSPTLSPQYSTCGESFVCSWGNPLACDSLKGNVPRDVSNPCPIWLPDYNGQPQGYAPGNCCVKVTP